MGRFYTPPRTSTGLGRVTSLDEPEQEQEEDPVFGQPSGSAPRAGGPGRFYIPPGGRRSTPATPFTPSPTAAPTGQPPSDDPNVFDQAVDFGRGFLGNLGKGTREVWRGTQPARDVAGNVLDIFGAGVGGVVGAGQAALGNRGTEGTYSETLQRNLDQAANERIARGESPELGVTDYLRAAPKVGQLAFSEWTPESEGGQSAKEIGELLTTMATDPSTYSPKGLATAARALRGGAGLSKGRVAAEVAEGIVGTPAVAGIYGPELVDQVTTAFPAAWTAAKEGRFLDAAGRLAQGTLAGGLGALAARGTADEFASMRPRPAVGVPGQAQAAGDFDLDFSRPIEEQAQPGAPPITEDALRQQEALDLIDEQMLERLQGRLPTDADLLSAQVQPGAPADVFARDLGVDPARAAGAPPAPPAEPPVAPFVGVPPREPITYGEAPRAEGEVPPPAERGAPAPAVAHELTSAMVSGAADIYRAAGGRVRDFIDNFRGQFGADVPMADAIDAYNIGSAEVEGRYSPEQTRTRAAELRASENQALNDEVLQRLDDALAGRDVLSQDTSPRPRQAEDRGWDVFDPRNGINVGHYPTEAEARAAAEATPNLDYDRTPDRQTQQERATRELRARPIPPSPERFEQRWREHVEQTAWERPPSAAEKVPMKDPGRALTREEAESMLPSNFREVEDPDIARSFQSDEVKSTQMAYDTARRYAPERISEPVPGVQMIRPEAGAYPGLGSIFRVPDHNNPDGATLFSATVKSDGTIGTWAAAPGKRGTSAILNVMRAMLASGLPIRSSDIISRYTRDVLAHLVTAAEVPWKDVATWAMNGIDSVPFTEVLAKGKGVEHVLAKFDRVARRAQRGAGGAGGGGADVSAVRPEAEGPLGAPSALPTGGRVGERLPGASRSDAGGGASAATAAPGEGPPARGAAEDLGRGAGQPGEPAGAGAPAARRPLRPIPAVATAGFDPTSGARVVREGLGKLFGREDEPAAPRRGPASAGAAAGGAGGGVPPGAAQPARPGVPPAPATPPTSRTYRNPVTGKSTTYTPRGAEAKVPPPPAGRGAAVQEEAFPVAAGKPSPRAGELETDINTARISTDPKVEEFVARTVESSPEYFGRGKGGARGPKRSWDEVRKKAVELGLDTDQVQQAFRRKGGFLSDVEMEAASVLQHEIYSRAKTAFDEAATARKEGRTGEADALQDKYDQEAANLASVTYAMVGARSEAARTLALARKLGQGLSPEERNAWGLLQKTSKFLRALKVSGKHIPNSEKFRADLHAAMALGDTKKVNSLLRQAWNKNMLDKYVEWWTSGILSGPPTHVVNFASNAAQGVAVRPAERLIEGALDKFFSPKGQERTRFAGEAFAMYRGLAAAQPRALWGPDGLFSAIKDIVTLKYEDKQLARALMGDEAAEDFLEFGRSVEGKRGEAIRMPLNFLQAVDQYWKSVARSQEMHATAYREGRKSGARGKELDNYVYNWLRDYSADRFPDVEAEIRRQEKAATYQTELGPIGRAVQQSATRFPLLRLLGATFIRTPTNLLKESFRHTPLGLAELAWKKGEITTKQRNEIISKVLFGSAVMTSVFAAMEQEGGLEITGGGPDDFDAKQELENTGWAPYSVRLNGGPWFSYKRLDPLSSVIGFAADMKELNDLPKLSDKFSKAGATIGENAFDKSFWSGLLGTMEAIKNPQRGFPRWAKQQMGSHVPMAGFMSALTRAVDPVQREADTFETVEGPGGIPVPEPMARRIPGMSQKLRPAKNMAGEPIERNQPPALAVVSPFGPSSEKTGPLADLQREAVRVGGVPDQPQRFVSVRGPKGKLLRVDLDDREYGMVQDFYKKAAQRASKMIASDYYKDLPDDEDRADALRKLYTEARAAGRARLYTDPAFRRKEGDARRKAAKEKAQ